MLTGHVIAITSGKGGVGKSTVSINLALALSRLNKRVAIIDLDIYGFSIPKMLNITMRPKIFGNQMIPVHSHNLKIMSSGFMVRGNRPIMWKGNMLRQMMEHFFHDVQWGELDYVILDLPPGTGDIIQDLYEIIPTCKEIIVTTPHSAASYVAERAATLAKNKQIDMIGIIENMSYFSPPSRENEKYYIFGKGGGQDLAQFFNTRLLATLPISIPDENGEVLTVYDEETNLFTHYNELAHKVNEIVKNSVLQ